jgi:2-polyprenyl-3-methyl-5-hydroxy-6-metoxy-1,4-benzoquinol methylase
VSGVHRYGRAIPVTPDNGDLKAPPASFDAGTYWEGMHRSNTGFEAVGFAVLGAPLNAWMYRVRRRVFRRAIRRAGVPVEGASVLDVGTGTGFYVHEWQRLGAAAVTGVDVSAAAIEHVRAEIPTANFLEADIADAIPAALGSEYDVISAFDVLFHIVEDGRFLQAIENLARLTRSRGHLLLSENFLRSSTLRHRHQVSRTRSEIDQALSAAGLEVVLRLPMFVLLNSPVDSQSRFLHLFWRGLSGVSRRSHRLGGVLGAALYLPELLLTALVREGPSTELVVCRRR